MSSSTGGSLPPNFLLTPQQQNLLFAALNSNKQPQQTNGNLASSALHFTSPASQPAASKSTSSVQDSPFLDTYDYDFGDSSFDFSFAGNDPTVDQVDIDADVDGSKSDSTENEGNEKRNHPDDDEDDEESPNGAKRRESGDRVPKKPGRKPLTSEPSSKRKAQNRAAQRAFRERKEKHLKDLETKVEELEKASEAANHENSLLRAQVERMNSELKQYKQKLSVVANKPTSMGKNSFGSAAVNNLSDVNFQFDFPKFGGILGPQPQAPSPQNKSKKSPTQPISPQSSLGASTPGQQGPADKTSNQSAQDAQFKEDLAKFNNFFSPSMSSSHGNGSRASLDSGNYSIGAATSSPSASSHSNVGGPSSSCGTSPEPFTQSPMGFKPLDNLGTIGEEHPTISVSDQPFSQFANIDVSSTNFDWLAQQNGGQFDPQLFGGYREPQDNVLSNSSFDNFFNDAIDNDFFTPYNMGPASPNMGKKQPQGASLIDQIDAQKESPEAFGTKQNMNCNQIWEKLQSCPKAQSGEFDLDGLCSELTKKAKCSGNGPVVKESDFDTVLRKYMGKDAAAECVAKNLGIEISKTSADGLNL